MSAVAYLASYLSRGKFLPSSFVSSMLKRLVAGENFEFCFWSLKSSFAVLILSGFYFTSGLRLIEWCFEYAKFWNGEETTLNLTADRVLYSGCQVCIV